MDLKEREKERDRAVILMLPVLLRGNGEDIAIDIFTRVSMSLTHREAIVSYCCYCSIMIMLIFLPLLSFPPSGTVHIASYTCQQILMSPLGFLVARGHQAVKDRRNFEYKIK